MKFRMQLLWTTLRFCLPVIGFLSLGATAFANQVQPFRQNMNCWTLLEPKAEAFLREKDPGKSVKLAKALAGDHLDLHEGSRGIRFWSRETFLWFGSDPGIIIENTRDVTNHDTLLQFPPAMTHPFLSLVPYSYRIVSDPLKWAALRRGHDLGDVRKSIFHETRCSAAVEELTENNIGGGIACAVGILYLSPLDFVEVVKAASRGGVPALDRLHWIKGADLVSRQKGCFAAGTQILTPTGIKAIEALRVGDDVFSQELKSGKLTPRKVTSTFTRDGADLWRVELQGSTVLSVTEEHPVYVVNRGEFVPVKDLKPDDVVSTPTKNLPVRSVAPTGQKGKVYNIEVEGEHNYFSNGVLVHNKAVG